MSTRSKLIAGLIVASGVVGLASSVDAAQSASVGGCTVTVHPVYIQYHGTVRGVENNVYVTCSKSRSGIVNAQLMEADVTVDDAVSPLRSNSFTIDANTTQKVLTVWGECKNFDPTGSEEIYGKAKINVLGINSSWAQTAQLSTTC